MRAVAVVALSWALAGAAAAEEPAPRYGSNPQAAGTFTHDGVALYYETYGSGPPLLVVHGNGGSIADMAPQIAHFRKTRRVIAMDSRDQGRSGDSPGPLTYELMTNDLAALIDHLHVAPVDVLGWSDGGIEALLMGMRHPQKVRKLVAMAANLNPSAEAVHPETITAFQKLVAEMPTDDTPRAKRERKVTEMVFVEPNIALEALAAISAPTLVVAGDHDLILDQHTVAIFQHLPNAHLAILPGATHAVPFDDPETFNAAVEHFLERPFVKPDRIRDVFESLGKLRASTGAE